MRDYKFTTKYGKSVAILLSSDKERYNQRDKERWKGREEFILNLNDVCVHVEECRHAVCLRNSPRKV